MTIRRLTFLIFSGVVLLGLLFVLLRIPAERPDAPPIAPHAAPPSSATGDADEAGSGVETKEAHRAPGSVRVVDTEGRPCRATVYAMGLAGRPPERADFIGDTGDDGLLPPGEFEVQPRGPVFARAAGRVAPPVTWVPAGVDLTLGEGVVVSGTVTGEDGSPVAGAVISEGGQFHKSPRTCTEEDGQFRVTGLYPGIWGISATVAGCSIAETVSPDAWDGEIRVALRMPAPTTRTALIKITFSEPPEARPLLLVGKGKRSTEIPLPLEEALVRIATGDGETRVEAVCPGYRPANGMISVPREDGEPDALLELVAGGGTPRAILVVTGEGRAVPNALLLLRSHEQDHHPDTTWTGPTGEYLLHARLRGWLVTASAKAGASEQVKIREGTEVVRLILGTGATVTGRIVDRATGEGVADTLVRLAGGDCPCCSPWSATTDSLGEYRFEGIPKGFFVQPWVAGGRGVMGNLAERIGSHAEAVAQGRGHLVQGGETVRMADIPIDRYEIFECRIRIEGGVPGERVVIEDARVEGGVSTHYRSLGDDTVLSFTLDAGRRLLVVESGGLRGAAWAELGAETPVADITVRLAPIPKVTAVVVGTEPELLFLRRCRIDADVFHREGGRIAWGGEGPDRDGRADLSEDVLVLDSPDVVNVIGIEAGSLRMKDGPVRVTGAELAAMLRDSPDGLVLELQVEEKDPLRIPVVVVDLDGKPVTGVRIGDPDEDEAEVITDAAGRAVISPGAEPLFPWTGEWDLPAKGSEKTLRVTVEPARKVRLRFLGLDGMPLAGVEFWGAEGRFWLETDEQGVAEVVLPARLEFFALEEAAGFWFPPVDLTGDAEETTVRPVRLRTVEVTVTGPEDLAVEREIGVFWTAGPEMARATGEAELKRVRDFWWGKVSLPPFAVSLRAVTSNLRYEGRADVSAKQGEVAIALKSVPDHEVTFLLLGPDGSPLANCPIYADEFSYTAGALLPPRAKTDGMGRLTLRVPEGAHVIEGLEAGDFLLEKLRFDSPAEGVVEVRLR